MSMTFGEVRIHRTSLDPTTISGKRCETSPNGSYRVLGPPVPSGANKCDATASGPWPANPSDRHPDARPGDGRTNEGADAEPTQEDSPRVARLLAPAPEGSTAPSTHLPPRHRGIGRRSGPRIARTDTSPIPIHATTEAPTSR